MLIFAAEEFIYEYWQDRQRRNLLCTSRMYRSSMSAQRRKSAALSYRCCRSLAKIGPASRLRRRSRGLRSQPEGRRQRVESLPSQLPMAIQRSPCASYWKFSRELDSALNVIENNAYCYAMQLSLMQDAHGRLAGRRETRRKPSQLRCYHQIGRSNCFSFEADDPTFFRMRFAELQ